MAQVEDNKKSVKELIDKNGVCYSNSCTGANIITEALRAEVNDINKKSQDDAKLIEELNKRERALAESHLAELASANQRCQNAEQKIEEMVRKLQKRKNTEYLSQYRKGK